MRILFVMDPPSTVIADEDTSFDLMLAAQARSWRVDHCMAHDLMIREGRAHARVRRATVDRRSSAPLSLGDEESLALESVDVVFVRKDPPFDRPYLWATQVLELLRDRSLVVNDPRGLRDANEKLYACHFPELMPRTLVSAGATSIHEFVQEVGGRAVIKPLDGAGGEGVMSLIDGDSNFRPILEASTQHGGRLAMVQEFLPAYKQGDKRILLLDGAPLGGILRVPRADELRSNIHVGGTVHACALDEDDQRIIAAVAPRLRQDGLWFVGLDVIGGRLTEVNVTSPTGIQQMARLAEQDLSGRVLDWLQARVRG